MNNSKATWDSKTTECFIKACLDQVYKGERNGSTFTKKGWKAIISEFNEKTGKQYDKPQFRNKWDNLRKEWSAWYKLFSKETGIGWDYTTNTVDARDDWWEKKLLENPQYGKYKDKGFPFSQELTILFKDVVATGKYAWAPSYGILPNLIDENDDVYRPSLDNACIDLEEGSGDSEENLAGSVGVSAELRNMNLNTSHGNSSELSIGKRKISATPCERNETKKKIKIPDSRKIADAISRIASASESRSIATNALIGSGTSIGEVMAELQQMEAITSDADWVQEILQGHPIRCYEMFRMEKHVFYQFCTELVKHGLKGTKQMGIQEMVAMFLNMIGHGVGNRMIQERFQHSGETVSRHFHKVLVACLSLSFEYIKPRDPRFRDVHTKIRNDRRYWPFFKNAIAIDGTHIACVVSPNEQPKFIGRKGHPTQNIMVVCDWDMCFIFALPGWEGTAHDARVFENALTTPAMNFTHPPLGKYYLVDSGYPTPTGYVGPYRCERYHLPDFRRSSGFANYNEVFNYYHSSLRCTIERTFGVWKNRFAILRHMPKYKFETQVQIVSATMAIHNFIRRKSETDSEFSRYEDENIVEHENDNHIGEESSSNSTVSSSREMNLIRDSIRDQIVEHMQPN